MLTFVTVVTCWFCSSRTGPSAVRKRLVQQWPAWTQRQESAVRNATTASWMGGSIRTVSASLTPLTCASSVHVRWALRSAAADGFFFFLIFSSVQFSMVCMHSGRPICVLPHLSEVSPAMALSHPFKEDCQTLCLSMPVSSRHCGVFLKNSQPCRSYEGEIWLTMMLVSWCREGPFQYGMIPWRLHISRWNAVYLIVSKCYIHSSYHLWFCVWRGLGKMMLNELGG